MFICEIHVLWTKNICETEKLMMLLLFTYYNYVLPWVSSLFNQHYGNLQSSILSLNVYYHIVNIHPFLSLIFFYLNSQKVINKWHVSTKLMVLSSPLSNWKFCLSTNHFTAACCTSTFYKISFSIHVRVLQLIAPKKDPIHFRGGSSGRTRGSR